MNRTLNMVGVTVWLRNAGNFRRTLLVSALVCVGVYLGSGRLHFNGDPSKHVADDIAQQNNILIRNAVKVAETEEKVKVTESEEKKTGCVSCHGERGTLNRSEYLAYRSLDAGEEHIECVQASFQSVTFPMCLYPSAEDKIVSEIVRSTGRVYEERDVKYFFSLFTDSRMGLIDIGANIGTYTIPAAHLGHKVVSVELVPRTALRLATSLARGNISDKVVLLNAAVSNERLTYAIGQSATNKGDSFLLDASECAEFRKRKDFNCMDARIPSVYLDELTDVITFEEALLKMDIQGAEYVALQKASRLFERVKIKAVLFEWVLFGRELTDPKTTASRRAQIHEMADFFLSRDYVPHDQSGRDLSGARIEKWSYNVIFKLKE